MPHLQGAAKAFHKKAQEEANQVTKILLAGLEDVTEAAAPTTNLHFSPSSGCKLSDHQVMYMYIYSIKQWRCMHTVSLTFAEFSTAQSG